MVFVFPTSVPLAPLQKIPTPVGTTFHRPSRRHRTVASGQSGRLSLQYTHSLASLWQRTIRRGDYQSPVCRGAMLLRREQAPALRGFNYMHRYGNAQFVGATCGRPVADVRCPQKRDYSRAISAAALASERARDFRFSMRPQGMSLPKRAAARSERCPAPSAETRTGGS